MNAPDQKQSYDIELIRSRLPLAEVCGREGVVFRKAGSNLVAYCPFHEEMTGSFTIHARNHEKAYCYGCGWGGDLFDFWQSSRDCDFKEAVEQLASLAGVAPAVEGLKFRHKTAPKVSREISDKSGKGRVKPPLPPLLDLTDEQVEQLAKLRGLNPAGIRVACGMDRLKACMWPQFQGRNGRWRAVDDAAMSWVVTDSSGWVAQFRRFDAEKYALRKKGAETRYIKMWTKGSPTWPLGAADIGKRPGVLLVEGGADLLAAYHFLWGFNLLNRVAVVCMLGAANRIVAASHSLFRGKRVRIMMDADEVKGEGRKAKAAGPEAARRWQRQLRDAGAVVEVFSLFGLKTAAGEVVKDLNDLALCSFSVVSDKEVTDAFFEFDF